MCRRFFESWSGCKDDFPKIHDGKLRASMIEISFENLLIESACRQTPALAGIFKIKFCSLAISIFTLGCQLERQDFLALLPASKIESYTMEGM